MPPVTVMVSEALFSSGKDDWQTPYYELFEPLHRRWQFVADMAANEQNHLLPVWYGPGGVAEDAIAVPWPEGNVWCNPPYSRGQSRQFIKKAAESRDTTTTVMLLPARTDTIAFHHFIYNVVGVDVRFLRGRVRFVGAAHGAPFPSMLVTFHRRVSHL
jgi:phage N-6-adenine-methyltransferase